MVPMVDKVTVVKKLGVRLILINLQTIYKGPTFYHEVTHSANQNIKYYHHNAHQNQFPSWGPVFIVCSVDGFYSLWLAFSNNPFLCRSELPLSTVHTSSVEWIEVRE